MRVELNPCRACHPTVFSRMAVCRLLTALWSGSPRAVPAQLMSQLIVCPQPASLGVVIASPVEDRRTDTEQTEARVITCHHLRVLAKLRRETFRVSRVSRVGC